MHSWHHNSVIYPYYG